MTNFSQAFSAEIIKIKNTPTPWILLSGGAFIPLLLLIEFLDDPSKAVVAEGVNPWTALLRSCFQFGSVLVIPLTTMILASLFINIEYKSNTWKHILVLPVSKNKIFLSKLLVVLLLVLSFYAFFILFLLVDVLIFKNVLRVYANTTYSFDWVYLAKLTAESYISILSIILIHTWLGLRIRNVVVVVSIGLVCLVIAVILASPGSFKGVAYFPYAYPAILSYRLNPLVHYNDLPYGSIALVFFACLVISCFYDFNRNFRG